MSAGHMLAGPLEAGPWSKPLLPHHFCFCYDSLRPNKGKPSSLWSSDMVFSASLDINFSSFRVLFHRPGFKFKN